MLHWRVLSDFVHVNSPYYKHVGTTTHTHIYVCIQKYKYVLHIYSVYWENICYIRTHLLIWLCAIFWRVCYFLACLFKELSVISYTSLGRNATNWDCRDKASTHGMKIRADTVRLPTTRIIFIGKSKLVDKILTRCIAPLTLSLGQFLKMRTPCQICHRQQ